MKPFCTTLPKQEADWIEKKIDKGLTASPQAFIYALLKQERIKEQKKLKRLRKSKV